MVDSTLWFLFFGYYSITRWSLLKAVQWLLLDGHYWSLLDDRYTMPLGRIQRMSFGLAECRVALVGVAPLVLVAQFGTLKSNYYLIQIKTLFLHTF